VEEGLAGAGGGEFFGEFGGEVLGVVAEVEEAGLEVGCGV